LVQFDEKHQENDDFFTTSEASPNDGILDPVTIEHVGYTSSGTLAARTDDGTNTENSLPLDDTHSWVGSRVDLDVRDLKKLYVLNGSFSEGTASGETFYPNGTTDYYPYGWSALSTSGLVDPEVIQSVTYENTGSKYIVVQSKAKLTNNPQHWYTHYNGTSVYWNQSIDITPATSDFLLSFDYLYQFGPINGSGPANPPGNAYLEVIIDGRLVYSLSLYELTERNSWFNSGEIPISFTPSMNPTTFMIGIKTNSTFVLDADEDYDYTPGADGSSNAEYITVWFDDVSFTAATPPSFDQVDLQLAVEGTSTPITGSNGVGSTYIPATGFWTTNPVNLQVSSNTTVSFEYEAVLRSHRFSNSTWMTDNTKVGVQYTIQTGASPELTFNTYIGFIGGYINLTTRAWFPSDWQNVTVFDPFLSDVTSSCSISANMVEIPTSLMDRLGWWRFNLDAPNYAKSIKSQIFDGGWSEAIPPLFRINDETRADITIGTDAETLGSLTNVNVTWYNPSDEIWESITLPSGGVLGQIYSGSMIFNTSSPAGEWWVEVYWTNGTEVAYDRANFALWHSADLIAEPSEITTDAGLTIKGIVRYIDAETPANILDASASVVANWSGSTIPFVANPVQNWWEADLDTSITGAGDFVIVVNASRPYYDDVSCQILIHSIRVTRLTSPNAPWTAAQHGDIVSLTFNYEGYDYSTETWLGVENNTDVSVVVNWTVGYWSIVEDITPGVYLMDLDTNVVASDTYLLNITFSKPNHESKTLLLTLIVSPTTSSLTIIEEISARVDLDESYAINMTYREGNGDPLSGATVVVDRISPETGLAYTPVTEIGGEPGNYTTSVTPHASGVFTIRFVASIANAENATTVFVLVVNDVDTVLDIPGSGSEKIGLTDVFNTTFRFKLANGTGIENAIINITYSGGNTSALSWGYAEIGLGDYSVEFSSTSSGTYLITIAASKPYHQSASDAFFLVVQDISTNINCLNGTADLISFGKDYNLFISYTNGTGHGLTGADVSIENVVSDSILTWEPAVDESAGLYSILLTPQAADTFTILVQANLTNHQTQFVIFTLTSTAIATTLTVLNTSTSISLDQTFTVYVLYQDEDSAGIENATVMIQNPPGGVSFSAVEDLGNGYYNLTITPEDVGTFDIIFKASKAGYQNDYSTFTLGATRIPTRLLIAGGATSGTMIYSEEYQMTLFYERTDLNEDISSAVIDVQGNPTIGFTWDADETENGYELTITPLHVGSWLFTITAHLEDYVSSAVYFRLNVTSIVVNVEILSSLVVTEGQEFNITARLTEAHSGSPITGAFVYFRLVPVGTPGAGEFIQMENTTTPGVYYAIHRIQLFLPTSQYTLEIKVNKDNYVVPGGFYVQSFLKENDPLVRATPFIFGGGTFFVGFMILVGVMRVRSVRKKRQLEIDIVNKNRFDDADNIIGVIVMHKNSGIPIYSRIVKGGFEEGIVAAFISAVTHFREEFEMLEEQKMQVIPISDIIRAVQTENLICAFITIKSASIGHNRKMESFAQQVATYLDDFYTESRPSGALDSRIAEILDYIYDETMDGKLIKFYKAVEDKDFPRRYRYLEQLLEEIETRHCARPVHMAQAVATFGISEAHGCTLVLEAIDKGLIE
ncbi:MAG: hypothetical protein ACFFBJ_10415, partial [Promethearchaeota archaeon]